MSPSNSNRLLTEIDTNVDYNTWSGKCVCFVLENSEEADVTFLVGHQKEEIKSFKFCLRVASPVFDRAFSTDWDNSNPITLPDIDPQSFRHFLKLIFTDKIDKSIIKSLNLPLDGVFKILYISTKYDVAGITNAILNFLYGQTTVKNAVHIYENIASFDGDRIIFQFIVDNFDRIIKEDEFLEVPMDVLAEFLKSDELRVNEPDLFKGLCNWGKFQYNKKNEKEADEISVEDLRSTLGELLSLIRFPLFTSRDFVDQVPKGLLSLEEAHSTLTYIVLSKEKKKNMLDENDFPFNVEKRRKPFTQIKIFWFPSNSDIQFVCKHKFPFVVDIVTDRKIRVNSFGFNGPIFKSCKYKITINMTKFVKDEEETFLCCYKESVIASKKRCFRTSSPVVVKPNNVDTRVRFSISLEGAVGLPTSSLTSCVDGDVKLYYNFGHPGPLAEVQYEEIQ